MARAFLFVLDSVGIGGAPDAEAFGDVGSNTLGHIAKACHEGNADKEGVRSGDLSIPNLEKMGIGLAAQNASGILPEGFDPHPCLIGKWANAAEISTGKDTPSGHWEIAGVPVMTDWGYFPSTIPTFPKELTDAIIVKTDLPGILGNKHASGTQIISELGEEHIRTGKPICYTSADSVFQIAAHEEHFGLDRLYQLCETVFELTKPLNIGRVIARPFVGSNSNDFERTGNRRDFSIEPPHPTLLKRVSDAGRQMIAIGKISDIYAHLGPTKSLKANGNASLGRVTLEQAGAVEDGGLLMTNFVDFDMLYGHRRDVIGYAKALEEFDLWLPTFLEKMRPDDLLILTADHGCDPTWEGTEHTREQVPILIYHRNIQPGSCGSRESFADIGATIAAHLSLEPGLHGKAMPI
ncbi:MAG: phosphopentomutase [Salaquimonas sp.]